VARAPFILLVNPWITDFAAHDLWAKPLGLLMLASLLREGGCGVGFIDCLDRGDPGGHDGLLPPTFGRFGTGKYPKTPIPTPPALEAVPRRYYRYGIHQDRLREHLKDLPRPELVFVNCAMTYWYPGLTDTITAIREIHADVRVWLGGCYARLSSDHARLHSGADQVWIDEISGLPARIREVTGFAVTNPGAWERLEHHPAPALDLLGQPGYAPVLTSLGCPNRCPYCASALLHPRRQQRTADAVYAEIRQHASLGIRDFAFYDDALLADADRCFRPLLERILDHGPRVRFHTPNALHIGSLSEELCGLLYRAGFETVRLGLETVQPKVQANLGRKVDTPTFLSVIQRLHRAGFEPRKLGVYLLAGMPGQTPGEVEEGIRLVSRAGAMPHLSEYSPLPGTETFRGLPAGLAGKLTKEPLYHNNSFFACRTDDFTYDDLKRLKNMARSARAAVRGAAPS
jgi:radical SAM superfamily enzyme YgiQ (UPF0313 family)